jgi:hypothetical protein
MLRVGKLFELVDRWWRGLSRWKRYVLWAIATIALSTISNIFSQYLVPPLWALLTEQFKVGGYAFLSFLTALISLIILVYFAILIYGKLADIASYLMLIAYHLGVKASVKSPGFVYAECTWLVILKEDPRCHFYVTCTHPQKPLTREGCPSGCPYFRVPPQPSGVGAYGGMILGGLLGLVVAGPIGVFLGGLLGGAIGHAMEVSSLEPKVRSAIRRCEEQKLEWVIHVAP